MAAATTPASTYAAMAGGLAAGRLRAAAAAMPSADALANAAINPSSPAAADMTAPLASLMTLQHQLGVAPAGSTTLNIHPTNGVTVKTTPAAGGTKAVHPASKPKPSKGGASATPNVGDQIASGDLIDAYNQEAKGIPGQVASIYSPIAASLNTLFTNRANTLQNAINSYTPIYGQLLGGYDQASKANYGEALQSQGAIDAALQAALGGQGAASADALAKSIGTTGVAPDVAARMEGANASRYQGEQGAAAARGAASLSQLLGQGTNAANYGAALPGVAGASGLLATRQGQAQISNDELSALNQLAQNEGQTSGQLYSDLRQALNNMGMLQLYYGPRGQAAQTTAGAKVTTANAYAGPYAKAAGTKAAAAATNAAANTTKAGAAVTRAGADVTRANAYANSKKNGGLTTAQAAKYRGIAISGMNNAWNTGMTYQQAIQAGREAGVPDSVLIPQANAKYPIGQRGRPLAPNSPASAQVDALASAGVKPSGPGLTKKQQAAANVALGQSPFDRLIHGGK